MNTQTIPAEAALRRRWAGQPVGYRVLNLDRSEFAPWTNDQVIETMPAGHFVAVGGVEAPAAGGSIVWGLADQDIASATIEPATSDPTPALLDALRDMVDALLAELRQSLAETQQMVESERDTRRIQGAHVNQQLFVTLGAVGRQLVAMQDAINGTHELISTDQRTRRKQRQSLALIEDYIEGLNGHVDA